MGPKAREAIMHSQVLGEFPGDPARGPERSRWVRRPVRRLCTPRPWEGSQEVQGARGSCAYRRPRRHRADRCACSHYGRTDGRSRGVWRGWRRGSDDLV